MSNKIISYAKRFYYDYRGDAPTPRSMELIQKNLDAVMETLRGYWEWKKQHMFDELRDNYLNINLGGAV